MMYNAQKYPPALKTEIAGKYRPYRYTIPMLSKEYGIPKRTIRDWIKPSKMPRYSDEIKAEVRKKYVPHVYSLSMCARYFNIPRPTIWLMVKK